MASSSELSKKLEQREAEIEVINSVQQGILAKKEMQKIYDLVGEKIRLLFDAQVVGIGTFNHETNTEHISHLYEEEQLHDIPPRPIDNLRKRLIETREFILINENADDAWREITGEEPTVAEGTKPTKSALFVPMASGDNVFGYITLQNLDREHAFSDSDVRLLNTMANSISMALENARLFNQTEQRNAELAVINSVQEGLVAEMDMQGIYDLVGDRIRDLFDTQVAMICTFDHENETEHFQYEYENGERLYPEPRPIDNFRRKLIDTKELILINENFPARAEEILGLQPKAVPGTDLPKSVLFVPLTIGDSVRGYVSLQNLDREHAFPESDVRLLSTLANSMSVALENARLFNETTRLLSETEKRATELQTVNRLSQALVSQLEFDALINLVGELMKETFKADIVYVAMYDRETNMIRFPYEYGDKNEPRQFGDGFTEKIITTNEPLLINKDLEETRDQMKAKQIGKLTSSFLGVPIQIDKETIGVISVQSTEEEYRFDENDQRLLNTIAANVSVAMQNAEAYQKLRTALNDLKAAQEQLVQQEKLASLGQLTAGIAHEIKNPLNFVNNFSELSVELIDEAREEIEKLTLPDENFVLDILDDIESNLKKINEHGTRADGIVKSMLQHSRGGSGKVEPTNINALIKEYVNLAFHGMRAGKNPINVDIDLDLDENAKEIPLIAEDFSRVILNLCNNAFDAMREKLNKIDNHSEKSDKYLPKLNVSTRQEDGYLRIEIQDNGPGIPAEIREKILQPFFTTKKGKDGTGLGLSITNDIVKSHGGNIDIQSESGNYTRFSVTIPYKNQ